MEAKKQTPEYYKWLYERRKLRFWKAKTGEELLENIAYMIDPDQDPHRLAMEWLEEALRREKEVGNSFDHERNKPRWLSVP